MKRRFVARTRPKGEFAAMGRIVRLGFDVQLPRRLERRRHARRIDTVRSPPFPVCAFVGMDVERARPRPLNSAAGVGWLIGRNGRPAAGARRGDRGDPRS